MNKSSKQRLAAMRLIRRKFWMGEVSWDDGLSELQQTHGLFREESLSFLGDSTNLDAVAKLQASLNAIPFGVSLSQPSICL